MTILPKKGCQLRLGEDRSHLRCQRDEERLLAFVVLPQLSLLDNKHAKQLTALNNRHAKESAEPLLFDGRDIFEAGVFLRVGKVDWLRQSPDQANNTFIKRERDGASPWFF